MAFNTSLINWFRRNRSRALGLVWSGTPLSGPLVGVVALLIIHLGWRDSAVVVGITIWAIGFPLALVIRHRPEPYGYLPDGDAPGEDAQTGLPLAAAEASGLTLREALRSRSFYILSIGIGIEAMVVSSLIVHQVAHLKNEGLSTGAAALVVSAAASAFLIGRLPFALLGDKLDKGRLLTIIYLLSAIAVVAFAYADAIWPIAIFVLLLGISHGIITPLRPSAMADYLGTLFPVDFADPNVALIGLTPLDLYAEDRDWYFQLGHADWSPQARAVVSTYRMHLGTLYLVDDERVLSRTRKLVTKYLGLMFYDLPLSDDPTSPMFGSILSVDDLDSMEDGLLVPTGP